MQALEEALYAFSSRVADWQETAAGMASGTALDSHGSIEVISMWVAPVARGHGVGDALVNAVVGWAREQQASRLTLGVLEGNERGRSLLSPAWIYSGRY